MFSRKRAWATPGRGHALADQRETELAIEVLRTRLEAAIAEGTSPALIHALAETLEEFEAGHLPHRFDGRQTPSPKRR